MLPAKGPWPHPYDDVPDGFVDVAMDDASHFLQVDAPERTVAQTMSFDPDAARAA